MIMEATHVALDNIDKIIATVKENVENIKFKQVINSNYSTELEYLQQLKIEQTKLYHEITTAFKSYSDALPDNSMRKIIVDFKEYTQGILKAYADFDTSDVFVINLDCNTSKLKVVRVVD